MTNHVRGAVYIGVTADLAARVYQHRLGKGSAHCRKYNLTRLVLAEWHNTIDDAIRDGFYPSRPRQRSTQSIERAIVIERIFLIGELRELPRLRAASDPLSCARETSSGGGAE